MLQVKSVFQVLQGFDTVLLYWDKTAPGYCEKAGVYVSHLSQTSLRAVLKPFLFAATCLKQVELFVGRVRSCGHGTPTLSAFASSVDSWLMVRLQFRLHRFFGDDVCFVRNYIVVMLISEAPQSSSEGGRAVVSFS